MEDITEELTTDSHKVQVVNAIKEGEYLPPLNFTSICFYGIEAAVVITLTGILFYIHLLLFL